MKNPMNRGLRKQLTLFTPEVQRLSWQDLLPPLRAEVLRLLAQLMVSMLADCPAKTPSSAGERHE
jgi:hypothetical protein